jgi:hypothetical protein
MSSLTSTEIIVLVVAVVLAVIVIGVLYLTIRRLRARKQKLLGELSGGPELVHDRAFNRIAMARREAEVLAAQGADVHRAQELIAEAQGAFDTHRYDHAYTSAQSAHEALVIARRQGSRTSAPPTASPAPEPVLRPEPVAPPVIGGAPLPSRGPARPTMAKNRAESQFQIHILGEELEALPPRRARDPSALDAADLRRRASQAFDSGDFTEAFRLALRGRRALGASLETLPPPGPAAAQSTGAEPDGSSTAPPDIAQTAETVAGGERCPDCGYPALAGDAFCRGCGRPHAPATCPTCGAPRAGDEPFCGRCGSRFT